VFENIPILNASKAFASLLIVGKRVCGITETCKWCVAPGRECGKDGRMIDDGDKRLTLN
jgi:hypothetical protein